MVCVDGLASYVTAFVRVVRDPVRTGKAGRPRLSAIPGLLLGQVIELDIALARSIVIAITVFLLNDDAPTATRAVAAAILIADRSNIFDTAIR